MRARTIGSRSREVVGRELLGDFPYEEWSRRPESNRDLALRRRSFYPLNYGEPARILRDRCLDP